MPILYCLYFILSGNIAHDFFDYLDRSVFEVTSSQIADDVGMSSAHGLKELVLTLANLLNRIRRASSRVTPQ